jgi:ribosomal protein L11 methyltransferase
MAAYTKFSVIATEEQGEILAAYLEEFPFDSFDYQEGCFGAYAPQGDIEPFRTAIEEVAKEIGFEDFAFENIESQNWNAAWESDFEEVEVQGRVLIRAPFHAEREDYAGLQVVIQPKMSFGTGHHATTQMMVEMLLESELDGKCLLDMGSGTGVLAIVAAKLGAEKVLAVEIDDMAEESVRENIALNYVADRVVSVCGDARAIEGKEFDIILANINRNILLNDMAAYVATLRSGGRLVMSGFYEGDIAPLVECAARLGLTLLRQKSNGEWRCIELQR